MTPEFAVEHIGDVVEELAPLTVAHHAEVNCFYDTDLTIDWDRYKKAKNV
jgi:hypothetical protein